MLIVVVCDQCGDRTVRDLPTKMLSVVPCINRPCTKPIKVVT
jgi:hypothetical protein